MPFELPVLPFAKNDLEPIISAETIEYHHGKHHQTYVNNLNQLIVGTEFEKKDLVEIIKTSNGAIFNNAAQVWNHTFYWNCLCAPKNLPPAKELVAAFNQFFGSFDEFKNSFTKAATSLFGSGWVWLVKNSSGSLAIISTSNAGNPLTEKHTPLLVCDVWEHAYYIDYRNARAKYLENFWKIVNWDFVLKNY
jgi:superoxide dismutase, Fe-Mn family